MANTKVIYSKDFKESVEKLDAVIRGKVLSTLMQFQTDKNSPGLNLERLNDCKDSRMSSIRVDRAYRIILIWLAEQQAYVLLYAAMHDDAYDWAKSKRVNVNSATTTVQLYDAPDDMEPAAQTENGLFPPTQYSDRTLVRLGVPEEQFSLVRSIRDADHLLEEIERFSPDIQERLLDLSTGTTVSEVLRGVEESKAAANGDPLQSPETLRSFTFVANTPELEQILTDGSLEQWRVFLHPAQRRLVQAHFDGPVLVEGGAGTGKTVTALYRAKELAARMIRNKEEGKILFTFYTANLIDDNVSKLRSICTPEEFKRITVQNIDSLTTQTFGTPVYFLGSEELKPVWAQAAAQGDPEGLRDVAFYMREWDHIAAEQEAFTLEEYLKVKRVGGGKPLFPEQREQVWKVFDAYQKIMEKRNIMDNKMAIFKSRKSFEVARQNFGQAGYRHIIVDEVQDFNTGALRLVRALAEDPHPDDLFLVGDTRQKIYDRKVSLSNCGIQTGGRRQQLYLNYRTTYQLQKAAVRVLSGETFDSLNGEPDGEPRYFSCTSGAEPQVKCFAGEEEEFQWILSEMRGLIDSGVSPKDICLTTCKKQLVDGYMKRLSGAGLQPYELKRTDDRGLGGVRVATMHRVKGLEFQYMFIAGVNKGVFPPANARGNSLKCAKCLLYVALTRAQKGAYVSGYGRTPSEFLRPLAGKK